MKKKLLLASCLLVLVLAVVGCGQQYMNLRGQVVDRFTGKPLAGVEVEVRDRVVETNANGYFSVKDVPVVDDVPVEERMIKVGTPGYKTYAQPVTLEPGDKEVTIKLENKRETKFFFVSNQDETKSIYLGDIYSDQQTKLTDDQGNDWAPAWSAEREEVLFLSDRGGATNLYRMKPDGSDLTQVTQTSADKQSPIWMGIDRIIFASNREGDYDLYLTNLNGSRLERLTDNDYYDGQPAYSADRQELAYISKTTGQEKLHLMKVDSNQSLLLNRGDEQDKVPAWTYEGKQILFVIGSNEQSSFYRINPNGSGLEELAKLKEQVVDYALWDKEDRLILYEMKGDKSKNLKLLTSKGEAREVISDKKIDYTEPEWKK